MNITWDEQHSVGLHHGQNIYLHLIEGDDEQRDCRYLCYSERCGLLQVSAKEFNMARNSRINVCFQIDCLHLDILTEIYQLLRRIEITSKVEPIFFMIFPLQYSPFYILKNLPF
jgi:hypothetical protein